MVVPAGYSVRAPVREDVAAIAAVLREDALEYGDVVLDAAFVETGWRQPSFDLARDAWVVVDEGGAVVGSAQVTLAEPDLAGSWGVVHPAHRGRGLGSELLDRIEERAREMRPAGPFRFRHAINAGDQVAASLLKARHLRPVRHFWHMQIDLSEPVDLGPAPRGIEISPLRPVDDLAVVHSLLTRAFVDDWDYRPEPFDRWVAEYRSRPGHDPTTWLIATDDGQPVGALIGNVSDDHGWIDELGVLPSHRSRGIGASLLRRSFATLVGRGTTRVFLNVDSQNATGATALYERVGMRIAQRWDLWERAQPNSEVE
jgi:mycothiol synthase